MATRGAMAYRLAEAVKANAEVAERIAAKLDIALPPAPHKTRIAEMNRILDVEYHGAVLRAIDERLGAAEDTGDE